MCSEQEKQGDRFDFVWYFCGHYIGEVIMYQSFTVPVASIPGNIIQIITGAIIAVPLILVTGTAVSHLIKNNKE